MNEDRIRNWQERRKFAAEAVDPVDAAPSADDKEAGPESRLDQARREIVERRRLRWRSNLRLLALLVLAPIGAIMLYVGLVATPLHEGEAVFTVQTSSNSGAAAGPGLFTVTSANSSIADAFKVRAFILSRPMLDHMEKRHGFLDHFAGPEMDMLTRYRGPFGLNRDPFKYYLKRVSVMVDVQEGILRLRVEARTPQDAIRFGNGILAAAERHVNAASDKIGADQVEALTRDVQDAERQVASSRQSFAAVQARRGDIAPEQTVAAVYQLISSLNLQLSEARRQRDALRAEGLVDSPLLPGLEQRVRDIQAQIAEQRGRLANPSGGSLSRTLSDFEGASSRKEIAQARWQSTLNTLQQAYLDLIQQRRYFVLIVGMSADTFARVRDVPSIAGPILLFLAIIALVTLLVRRYRTGEISAGALRERLPW